MTHKTAALLIGFGGPKTPGEVGDFLRRVTEGARVPESRLAEVARHYEAIGGVSPYDAHVGKFRALLEKSLGERGLAVPVLAGFRHSTPSFEELWRSLGELGVRTGVAFVLSPFRSEASFERYRLALEAKKENAGVAAELVYTAPFHAHPLFVESWARRIREKISSIPAPEKTFFIYSAHSIPVPMARRSRYAEEFRENASLISEKLGIKAWAAAYQSRSGNPADPWLEPAVAEAIRGVDMTRFKNVLVIPSGFLCDNAEVLYDLDIEARKVAEASGLSYSRAATVLEDPDFVRMAAELVGRRL
ncbi:MAG: ferrochelatase [Candidatus Omnitrophica bacterium]|nr:ferrochelatase [Candidatus Omnitrophota bacterium]